MKNFKLNFFHICDYTSLSEGGKLNILGIFRNIIASRLPHIQPQLFIITNIAISKSGKYNEYIKIITDDESEIAQLKFPIDVKIPKNKKVANLGIVGKMNNLQFKKKGTYKFRIYIEDTLVGEQEIELIIKTNNTIQRKTNVKTK